jgi:hypothetical protein
LLVEVIGITPPELDWKTLQHKAALFALVSLLAAAYPPEVGRDNFCLHLAGALVHWGVEVETAEEIVTAIAKLKGDTENRSGKAQTADAKKKAGEPITGLPPLLEKLGLTACESRLRSWSALASLDAPTANASTPRARTQ